MAKAEDYLDNLLESISEAKSNTKRTEKINKNSREERIARRVSLSPDDDFMSATGLDDFRFQEDNSRNTRGLFSESDFLRDFENELEFVDDSEFIKEFERELFEDEGVDIENTSYKANNIENILESVSEEKEEVQESEEQEVVQSKTPEVANDTISEKDETGEEDALLDDLTSILNGEDETTDVDPKESVEKSESNEAESNEEKLNEEEPTEVESSEVESNEMASEDQKDEVNAASEVDFGDQEAIPLDENLEALFEEEPPRDSADDTSESDSSPSDDGDEELDLAALLEAADEADGAGNDESQEDSAQPKPKASGDNKGGDSVEDEVEEKKGGLLAKLFGMFKKKDGEDGEDEESDEVDDALEAVAQMDSEPEVDPKELKKQQKKEEKERKKKEKEEKKKQKEKEKKEKPPKEKKKKEKKPKKKDTSPKVPKKVLFLFLVLAVSIVVFVMLGQKTVFYTNTISDAKGSFDKGEYLKAYSELSGVEVKEDDVFLYQRIEFMASLANKYDNYNQAVVRGDQLMALDALILGEGFYKTHKKDAEDFDVVRVYDELGGMIRNALSETYGIDEEKSDELYNIHKRKDYTKELYAILESKGLWSR